MACLFLCVRLACSPLCHKFVHGQREGVGRWVSKAGQEYVGEWKIGKMSGVGQSTEKDGTGCYLMLLRVVEAEPLVLMICSQGNAFFECGLIFSMAHFRKAFRSRGDPF